MQWLLYNKEVISMFANIGTLIAVGFAARALFVNAKAVRLQREASQTQIFHNISQEINLLLKEENDHIDDQRQDKITYENWLDRMLTALEYYAFYANRDYLAKEMSEFYMPDIEHFCNQATKYPDLMKEINDQKERLVYCELTQYFKKYIGKKCPI